jgi:site-specific DNA-methyltransferase (cytosine-N4-specific)
MKALLKDPTAFYTPKLRPSGHDIGDRFAKDNGGAIPSNLLVIPNSESGSSYLQLCRQYDVKPHPARFPRQLPEFFIKFLTEPGDLVIDIFGGSGTSGEAAELLGRKWITVDIEPSYVRASAFRFCSDRNEVEISRTLKKIDCGEVPSILPEQPLLL